MPLSHTRETLRRFLSGPQALAFLPALMLGGYWLGGEGVLIVLCLVVPVLLLMLRVSLTPQDYMPATRATTDNDPQARIAAALDEAICGARETGRGTACLLVELDDFADLRDRLGHSAADEVLRRTAERLRGVMRDLDIVLRLDGALFAVVLSPVRRADLEALIQISARLQAAVAEPLSLDASIAYTSCSVGFCLASRSPRPTGGAMLKAAELALEEAAMNGPGAIRSYSEEMGRKATTRIALVEEVASALEHGQIRPWFQPQVSTDTGRVSGFEALARWEHPQNGMIAPAEFLPAIEQAGLTERLGEIILFNALKALRDWRRAGYEVPSVGVNFSGHELRNPKLVDKVRWELDRFDIEPARLSVEILETVVAGPGNDVVSRNIAGLSELGCRIDLDDFGTGHASITNIRRFAVRRIKIDRSFVARVDSDAEQQRMVSAILTMAERLELETLAEGVETIGEHAMLAQLGCQHVQGFGLARPMPYGDTLRWMEVHNRKLAEPPEIGREAG